MKTIQELEEQILDLEAFPAPLFFDNRTWDQRYDFLKHVAGKHYPESWYLKNPKQTQFIFKKEYRKWLTKFYRDHADYEEKQLALKHLKQELKRRKLLEEDYYD